MCHRDNGGRGSRQLTRARTEEKFKTLFKEAGLRIVRTELQKGFPKELYAVRIWALQPEVTESAEKAT